MYLKGSINVSTYILFLILSANFLSSFKALIEFGGSFSMLLEGAGKVKDIINLETQSSGDIKINEDLKGHIEFNNVCFGYTDEEIITNLNLEIKPKTTVALVGSSGSGKTTIGRLIGRFWDVTKGSLNIDKVNIEHYDMEDLMDNVSFVFQDVFMLEDTIYENIKMGLDRIKEEIIKASKKAQIHEFIEGLPEGYNTILGEKGIKLSGGEKQRISIARDILKDSPIILLDEATASLDADNELEIRKSINKLTKGKAVIVIAHRLNTIKDSDNIIVLNEGKIEEMGEHNKLMENKKRYYDMYTEMIKVKDWVI